MTWAVKKLTLMGKEDWFYRSIPMGKEDWFYRSIPMGKEDWFYKSIPFYSICMTDSSVFEQVFVM